MNKVCCICQEDKAIDCFTFKNVLRGTRQSYCRECKAAYNKKHYNSNKKSYYDNKNRNRVKYRQEFFDYIKTLKCTDCGNDDYRVLEFDHLSDKEFNIAEKAGRLPLSSIMNEINKCEPVCANCHRIRTIDRGNWYKV